MMSGSVVCCDWGDWLAWAGWADWTVMCAPCVSMTCLRVVISNAGASGRRDRSAMDGARVTAACVAQVTGAGAPRAEAEISRRRTRTWSQWVPMGPTRATQAVTLRC